MSVGTSGSELKAGDLVTIFGGSGFVGRYLVRALAEQGYRVRVAVRRPNEALFLKPMGDVGQVQPVQANIRDQASCAAAIEGADAVVNLVGVLYESGAQKFDAVHAMGAKQLAALAADTGITNFLQMSAIGADADSTSAYARSKATGEAAVLEAIPTATIVRPSILFGPEDQFFNRFAAMASLAPALPLIGGGETKYQPVYVKDVAAAITVALQQSQWNGKVLELGGPEVATFAELMKITLKEIGRSRPLVKLPSFAAKAMASVLQILPAPLLTVDQVELLKHDNVVSEGALGLSDLGIEPSAMSAILPAYLYRFRRTGQFADGVTGDA
ncbi:3 beta-hydroxysteroid dehydrogenase/Delta 5--_4-isomerase [Rhodobiaceae bacterium]|nr:3 beta-hydroxysteroid dehydrogenase/Delta 5-->4-isomerase [Rhodobiaceae bacterium]